MFYSLKNRLIAIFVLLLVISFGAMSFLLFNQSRSIIRGYIESSALEKMDEYASFIDMATAQIYDLSSIVFNSDAVKTWDNALMSPATSEGDKLLASLTMSQFLTRATNSYSGISSVTLYRDEGLWVSSDNRIMQDDSFLKEPWYRGFKQKGQHWYAAHIDPAETDRANFTQVVSLLMPIGTFEPTASRVVMKVNVSADFLLDPLNRIHLGDQGTIFLLDENGRPLLGQTSYESSPQAARMVQQIRSGSSSEGVMYLKNEQGSNDIMVYEKIKKTNWMLVGFVPEADLFANLFKLRTTIIIISTLLLICAIAAASWLSYGITKPLSMLAAAMRFVQKGDFAAAENRIPSKSAVQSEVTYVTSAFRNMVSQLQHHIKTEFELKLLRQQAEYKALLMQINPHFLFNTLELMTSLTLQQRTDETVRVIEALGKMLRSSLKSSEDLIPLEEELKYLRYYISILQIRFSDKLDIAIEEHGELARLKVVKFILQPLVENSVKYSFQHQPMARVRVTARHVHDKLLLTVSDNGPGIPKEQIAQLRSETDPSQFNELIGSDRRIGLRNVLARGQLYYGKLFSFRIEAEAGRGTSIELTIPVQGGRSDVPSIDRG